MPDPKTPPRWAGFGSGMANGRRAFHGNLTAAVATPPAVTLT